MSKAKAAPPLVPKLRFPEFQGAGNWTTVKLGTVATISTEKVGNNVCVPMSITSGIGLVSQEEKFGRVIAGDSYKNYLLLRPNDFAYNKSATKEYPEGFLTLYTGTALAAVPNSIFTCFRINERSPTTQFLNYQFSDNLHGRWLRQFIQVGARAHGSLSINDSDLMALPMPVPAGDTSVEEQEKITECLSSVDELITVQAGKVDALKTHKKGLMQQLFPREGETQPRLRFPDFQNTGDWAKSTVEELTVTVTPPKKLQTTDYRPDGEFPIVDQSQANICGWTNDDSAVIDKGLPVIVFGDHTCTLKFVDRPFAQGADGIKILRPKRGIDIRFLFCALESDPVAQESYKRHFSMLKEKELFYPDPKSGEQQRLASCLSSLDALISTETQKLEALRTHKKGLMQQLFPSPEEVDA